MNWKPLPLSALAAAQLRPLLISTIFNNDAYTIHLTDLTYIWSESLDRKAIIRRSRDENTSIDPSSGDQFAIFLEKIKLGLAGKENTTCALTVDSDTGRPSLALHVTVNLPGGLAPLEWPIRLSAAPQAVMTSQLILPLMRAQHMRVVELEGLKGVLRGKDHVIQKVVDKLEASGSDMGQLFPKAAGKSGRKGEWDRKKVKGMAEFDMDAWRQGLETEKSNDVALTQLIEEVFDPKSGIGSNLDEAPAIEDEEGDWWENIKGVTINLTTGKLAMNRGSKEKPVAKQPSKSKSPVKTPSTPSAEDEESTEDEAFQVQSTPPRLVSVSKELTDAENDPNALSQHSKIPDSFQHSPPPVAAKKAKKKIGAVGGKQAAPKPQPPTRDDDSTADEATPPPPMVEAKPKKALGKIGGKKQAPPPDPETESEPEPEVEPEPEPSSSTYTKETTPEPTTTKPKRKLGQIGGKKKKETTPVPEIKPESPSSAATPAKKKLGIVGKKRESSATPQKEVKEEDGERGRAAIKTERTPTPPPRETSAERADKKREQLKRELEQKAKAPVKKKRKF